MARRLAILDVDKCVGCQSCMFACSRRFGEGGTARSHIHVRSAGGMERGFVVIVCRACPDPPCARVCPTGALKPRRGGGVTLKADLCLGAGCRLCELACPFGAVMWDKFQGKPLICIHCGICARYCPYGVITLEERTYAS